MIGSGIALAFISFFVRGDVTDGVLLYLAQALTFAGGVYGLNIYFRTKLGAAETSVKEYIDEKVSEYDRRRRKARTTAEDDSTDGNEA